MRNGIVSHVVSVQDIIVCKVEINYPDRPIVSDKAVIGIQDLHLDSFRIVWSEKDIG